MKRIATLLSFVLILGAMGMAQDCCNKSKKVAKKGDCGQACEQSAAKVVKQDKKAKKSDCQGACESQTATVVKQDKKAGSGCEKLDGYMALQRNAAKGCEKSKAKLAALDKENPKLAEMARLYKAACNGCEKSKAKLAAMRKDMMAKKAECSDCDAKQVKKSDCQGACESQKAKVISKPVKKVDAPAKGTCPVTGAQG